MLTRRRFIRTAAAAPALSILPHHSSAASVDQKRLNVVLIMVDDLCPHFGAYGATEVHSPNLDRLARKGMRFDRAYCQYPVCNPSRQSLLTGFRPDTTGIVTNWREECFRRKIPSAVSLPQLFRQNGYHTAGLGKTFHCGMDASGKLTNNEDPLSWNLCGFGTEVQNKMPGEGRSLSAVLGKDWPPAAFAWLSADGTDDDQEDGRIAAAAVKLIQDNKDAPFFFTFGFHKPHDPHIAPKKYYDLYPLDKIQLPADPDDRTPNPPFGLPMPGLFSKVAAAARRELKRSYYACVSFVDAQIGRVLDELDRSNLWNDTVVVLIADHGYHLWQHDWFGKCTSYELSARVPLLVWAPGHAGMGSAASGIVESLDLYPTIASLCGLTPPREIEGASFLPILDDPSHPGKVAAHTQVIGEDANYRHPGGRRKPNEGTKGYSVRTDRWRFTQWSDARTELYDHSSDSLEYHNLAPDPAHKAICAQLQALLPPQARPAAG